MNISTEIPRQSLATLSQQLAHHAVTTDYGAIPEPVKDAAKLNMLDTDYVWSIRATVTPYIDRIVGGPYDPSGDAQVAAQFNLRYSIACALVRRKLGLEDIQESTARDPLVRSHIAKISVEVDSALNSERGPVVIDMHTKTHGHMSSRVEHVPGSMEAPLSESEINEKLQECFRLGVRPLTAKQIAELTSRVHNLEPIKDMSTFFDGVC